MTERSQYHYDTFSLTDFIALYEQNLPVAKLYELSLPWLKATADFMLMDKDEVRVHCLFQYMDEPADKILLIAWPLVHKNINQQKPHKASRIALTSLTSFYSSVVEPIFFTTPKVSIVKDLLYNIKVKNPWHTMLLGPFESGFISQALADIFPYQKHYASSCNFFQENINNFEEYYQKRPSQLRNTIKRREKKLAKDHPYLIEIITSLEDFPKAFHDYQLIYQQSWKDDEFSFAFIEQVCLAAIAENKLRLGILYVGDKPVAAQLWFLQLYSQEVQLEDINNKHSSKNSDGRSNVISMASIFKLAYVPLYQKYSVGSILSLAISKHVIANDKVTGIEFGMGNEPYKKDWLEDVRLRHSYQIFNPSDLYGKLTIIQKVLLPKIVKFFQGKLNKNV